MVSLKEKLQAVKEGREEPPPIAKTLGMNLVQLGEGKALFTMRVDKRFHTIQWGLYTEAL